MLRILSVSIHTPVADVELEGTGEALRSPSRRPGRPVDVSRHRKRNDICMYIYLRDDRFRHHGRAHRSWRARHL